MFFEQNKGITFLISTVLITILITGTFMYQVRPGAVIVVKGEAKEIRLVHKNGEDLEWSGLRLSVTHGRNSSPVFRDPTRPSHPMGPENKNLSRVYVKFLKNSSIKIKRTSEGKTLVPHDVYHVVLKHKPTGIVLTDMNARVREKYGRGVEEDIL